MKSHIVKLLNDAATKLWSSEIASLKIEVTPGGEHATYATNLAMQIAKKIGTSPIKVAEILVSEINDELLKKVEVAGPGFINFFLSPKFLAQSVNDIISEGNNYGRGQQNRNINIEFVSANPTGNLHIGHARGGAVGSALVNILRFAGNKTVAEYYINDAGVQIKNLGVSFLARLVELSGNFSEPNRVLGIFAPENVYQGQDTLDIARDFYLQNPGDKLVELASQLAQEVKNNKLSDAYLAQKIEANWRGAALSAKDKFLAIIKDHLSQFAVTFDIFTSELSVSTKANAEAVMKSFIANSAVYEEDGAKWVKTTEKGDDKDRVLVKSDGTNTYFFNDIIYHKDKINRGFDEIIDVLGADHVGHIIRLRSALELLGFARERLAIVKIEMVKLLEGGQEVKMSKRTGKLYTLSELVATVGSDAARWFLLDRSNSSPIAFDIDLARNQSNENPVFAVQYAHARANQLILKSKIETAAATTYDEVANKLIEKLLYFPDLIIDIANERHVNLLPQYLLGITSAFNSFYSQHRIIGTSDEALLIRLVSAVKQVLANGLKLLGISAPESM